MTEGTGNRRRITPRRVVDKVIGREANARADRLEQRLDQVAARSRKAMGQVRDNAKEAEFHVREVNRIGPQLAALEQKVEELREQLEPVPTAGPDELAEARSLVETIRAEHARIRVRLSAVTSYEERLRRIEAHLGLPHD